MGYVNGNDNRESNSIRKDQTMAKLEDLPAIVRADVTADFLGKSIWWLRRRRHIPIYAPNANGEYPRRKVELIVDVEAGVYTAEQAHLILQAEYDTKRAQGAVTIANARKRRAHK